MASSQTVTVDNLAQVLENDNMVKLAGVDVDGILRGKLVSKKKFLSIAEAGFGFCSVIFGWDMHDRTYVRELKISNAENGYHDLLAIPDLSTFRRIPWEDNVPLFLVDFLDPDTQKPICACPRGLVKTQLAKLKEHGYGAMAGAEYEFYQFKSPDPSSSSPAAYLQDNPPHQLPALTEGMFGYSLTRPVHNQDYYYDVFNTCAKFSCNIEGWHTESGPGVFEAALEFGEIAQMADRAALFKYVVKSVSTKYGITPCFMAKPKQGLPGNSGHMHVSIVDKEGKNLFARETKDENPKWRDIANLSDMGRHFLAGILVGLPDIMPILAPTINSYKRLVENFWAPVTVSWGLEHRAASIRLICPKPSATRFEVRVPGADTNPHLVLSAILGCGWRGVEKKLEIPTPPLAMGQDVGGDADQGERLAKSLKEATVRFMAKDSIAREVFGDDFVEHFGGTREHEVRLYDEAVTDWEMKRYIETSNEDARWVGLKKITYTDQTGVQRTWESAERLTRPKDALIDGVGIVAILAHSHSPKIVLQKQFRPPVNKVVIEVPAGLIDEGETAEECAVRELREETGYVGVATETSPIMFNDPGFCNTNLKMVHVRKQESEAEFGAGEFIETFTVELTDLWKECERLEAQGHVIDARVATIAEGILLAQRFKL
ncbi:Type-1 glutamine synthetase 2 [Fusarium culmorum]|uniref:Glutamine synthetase n=1 Tax=Fusarium culmorum TaxID=5516 RepID=A0A2T4H7L9_FUSCU|nr:Type-1 glutamine synthetase 2 [Fusarium culmorum]